MLNIQGTPQRLCNGLTRRDVLRAGGAGLFGTSLTQLLAAEEAGNVVHPRAKSVMFLFMFGGPSQLETFDMKPDAPSGIRGPCKPIASRTPGLRVCKHLLPGLDQAFSALLSDMSDRGLLDETLIVCVGEMGRTPKPDTGQWGRGHWSRCFPAVLAGAGIRGGTTYGRSDRDAGYPTDQPVSPEDLSATVFHALGISPETRLLDAQGRPAPVSNGGHPLETLFG